MNNGKPAERISRLVVVGDNQVEAEFSPWRRRDGIAQSTL
jgi:hypothetical protein